MNNKVLTVTLITAGLLLAALITYNGSLALMALPFLFYLGAGILQAPQPAKIRLVAERSVSQARIEDVEGLASVDVRVTVRNEGPAVNRLVLSDPVEAGTRISAGHTCLTIALNTGESALLQYTFQANRGSFHWSEIKTRVSDPCGLIETDLALPAEGAVEVQPVVKKFRHIPLRPGHTLHASGPIPARIAGNGTDFWGVREYHPGDSLRWLDWRMTARHPRKFFTKEFEEEEIADIGLILDAREVTNLRCAGESLFEYSVDAAAALAEVYLRGGNRVSMLIYGDSMVRVFPGYGKGQLNRILRTLAKANAGSISSLNSLDYLPVRLFPRHAFINIISPLAPIDWDLFPRLRAHGYEAMLISPDPVDFSTRLFAPDPANSLALRAARIERRLQIKRITGLGIPVVDWQVQQPLSGVVHEAINRTWRARRERM